MRKPLNAVGSGGAARVARWRARNPERNRLRQWAYDKRYQAMRRLRLMEAMLACALP